MKNMTLPSNPCLLSILISNPPTPQTYTGAEKKRKIPKNQEKIIRV